MPGTKDAQGVLVTSSCPAQEIVPGSWKQIAILTLPCPRMVSSLCFCLFWAFVQKGRKMAERKRRVDQGGDDDLYDKTKIQKCKNQS